MAPSDPSVSAPAARGGPAAAAPWLLAATGDLMAAGDLRAGLERVAERVRAAVPYDTFCVLLLDDLGRELRFALAVGVPDAVAAHWRFGFGQGIVGTVAATGEPILAADVTHDPRYIPTAEGIASELAVPLRVKDRVIGVLDVASRTPAAYDGDDVAVFGILADHLAAAIEAQRLYDNVRAQARMLSVLHELSREMTAVLDRRRVLERVAERLRSLIPYDVFTVLLWNERERVLEPWLSMRGDRQEASPAHRIPLGVGICGTAAALRQVLRVPNVTVDPRFVVCNPGLPVRSEIAVPLVFEERLIGVLDLESIEFDAFDLGHEQLLGTLGASLAVALANAEMYERVQEGRRRLDEDLRTAREVQRRLLPRSTPWMPGHQLAAGYEPARQLGGDFYDFFAWPDGRLGVAIGDAAGKGASAALYGSLGVGILRELAAGDGTDPATVLGRLNLRLRELGIPNRFLAMIFAAYDPKSRRLRLANSGLPYPFLVRGDEVREVEAAGVPLGLLKEREYQEVELELAAGDAVVFASDGLVEALDGEEREFGQQRMEETLRRLAGRSASDVAAGLLAAVRRFSEPAEPSDDRTAVVLKVCESPCAG